MIFSDSSYTTPYCFLFNTCLSFPLSKAVSVGSSIANYEKEGSQNVSVTCYIERGCTVPRVCVDIISVVGMVQKDCLAQALLLPRPLAPEFGVGRNIACTIV